MGLEKNVRKVGTVHCAEFALRLQQHFWRVPEGLQGQTRTSYNDLRAEFPPNRLARELRSKRLSSDFVRIYRQVLSEHGWVDEIIAYHCRPERKIILDTPQLTFEILKNSSALNYGCSSCGRQLAREYFNPL